MERKTGVPRSTLYFYIRRGLIPEPQRTSTGRSLYSEDHVELLHKISELKREGRSLAEIKRALDQQLARARENGTDLAAQETERVRAAIIGVATEEFVNKGYKGTHVMEIIQRLEINPHIFYHHFPSKLDLLVECFKAATPPAGPRTSGEGACTDLGEHVLHGLVLDSRWGQLSAILSVAMRSEGQKQPVMHQFSEAWQQIITNVVRDFESVRDSTSEPPIPDELIAYGLLGAHRYASVRATWDDTFHSADLLRSHLFVFLSLIAGLSGEVDIYSRVARYEKLIQELTADKPELPLALEV